MRTKTRDHGKFCTLPPIDKSTLTLPQQAMTPITPLEPGVEMFERGKTQSFFSTALTARSSLERPLSHISVAYTDIEDDSSEFEEYSGSSVCDGDTVAQTLLT